MKTRNIIILILFIAFVFVIVLWTNDLEEKKEPSEKAIEPNFFERLRAKITVVEKELEDAIKNLRLTVEMENFIGRKIHRYEIFARIVIALITIGTFVGFYNIETNVLTALSCTVGVWSLALAAIPFLFISKTLDLNSVMLFVKKWIQKSVYKKFNYDPERKDEYKNVIMLKSVELENLKHQAMLVVDSSVKIVTNEM